MRHGATLGTEAHTEVAMDDTTLAAVLTLIGLAWLAAALAITRSE